MKKPISNLSLLLQNISPKLHTGVYAYCVAPSDTDISELSAVVTVLEPEGLTVVVPEEQAIKYQLKALYRAAWITLTVYSDLKAVGLTASFSTALSEKGISCNVVAGAFHDHIFVPIEQAEQALAALQLLQKTSK